MKRRRLIAVIALCTLAAMGLLVAIAGVVVMRTDVARNFIEGRLAAAVNGSVHLGKISGNPFSGLTIDTVAIRDAKGEMVVSTGKVSVDYDIRDLADTRIYLRHLVAEHPLVHLRQDARGRWNYQELFRKSSAPKGPKGPGRSWGDFIVLDSVRAVNATFILSLSWNVDSTISGAKRDSIIRAETSRKDRRIEKTADGYARTYIWTGGSGLLPHMRLADPDSAKFGQEIHIAAINVNEFDPPFHFRNLRGVVRRLGDSVWLDLPHFDLPGSTGSGKGKIVWGSNLPIRYDIAVRGDSVSLADVSWVYPTLPTTGSGSMLLHISNKRNVHIMDYQLDSLNMRSTKSHLTGAMTFGVGGPILQLRNVNIKADPLDFDLIRTFSGKPFPIDWRGQIFGNIDAPGGSLDDFIVNFAQGEWRDTHVPGAVSRLSGRGGLNIVEPAFTVFHDFDVNVGSLDLRSIEYLFPAFPKLRGFLSGRATLDSIWTDVRFHDADITHRDGLGTPSRFTGSGRVTDGTPFITYDVDLMADPLSFDMLSRSFPAIKLRGLATGPIRIKGQSPDLQINATLASAGGVVRFAGNIDIDSLGGYGARGVGEATNIDLSKLLTKPDAAVTSLNGQYSVDVRGSSASTLTGTADVRLGRSSYERIAIDSQSTASVRFENGKARIVDKATIRSPLGLVTATGGIGLPGGGIDSVALALTVDSIAGFRPFLSATKTTAADSLRGGVRVNGYAIGRIDSLLLSGTFAADTLFIKGFSTDALTGTFRIANALSAPAGTIEAKMDSVQLIGMLFDSLRTRVNLVDSTRATFAVDGRAESSDTLTLNTIGSWTSLAGLATVRLDTFRMSFADADWRLDHPATLATDTTMFRIDGLALRSARGGSIDLAGEAPRTGAVNLHLTGSGVPLADIDRIAGRVRAPLHGITAVDARVTGTYDAPVIESSATLDSIAISDVRIGRLLGKAHYANNQAVVNADIFQGDARVFHAVADSLPLAIRFFGYDTLPGRLHVEANAEGADFTLIESMINTVSKVTGKIFGTASLNGTWSKPALVADAYLSEGAMNIDTLGLALSKMFGHASYLNDTLRLDSLVARSGGDRNTASFSGVVSFDQWSPKWFDVRANMNDFMAYNRSELATIYARTDSGPLHLVGTFDSDTLTGIISVDRGSIYLPDPKLAGKRFSQAVDTGFAGIGIHRAAEKSDLYDRVTKNLFTELKVHLGGAFRLSADYADIPLTGDLRIVPVTRTDVANKATDYISRLAPEGVINADRGTYTLDLFPVRKTFDVQRGGTITFDRDAEWNGLLNVSALYTVRKPGQPEVPIVVEVTDRLLSPQVHLKSAAAFQISESDLISYLVFDQPGFDVLGQTQRAFSGQGGLASSLFTPIATSYASEKLKQLVLGRWIDQFSVKTASLDQATGQSGGTFTQLLNATRLTGGRELIQGKLFASVSAGFCGVSSTRPANQNVGQSLLNQAGLNLDYRLRTSLFTGATWQLSSEPSTTALLCSPSFTGSQGTAPTPRQYSLSFLKFWRW